MMREVRGTIDVEEAVERLESYHSMDDIEMAHVWADEVLLEILEDLGMEEVVEAFRGVPRWYA